MSFSELRFRASRRNAWPALLLVGTLGLAACGGSDDAPPEPPPAPPAPPEPTPARPDPLADQQWFLNNTGQAAFGLQGGKPGIDLNLQAVHRAGILGQGVPVLVLDSGLQPDHEDLAANIDPGMLYSFDPRSVSPTDPSPIGDEPDEGHGVAVAGIIGAVRGNGLGGSSVAPEATLGGARFICGATGPEVSCDSALNTLNAFGRAPFSQSAWVINGSYGVEPGAPILADFDSEATLVVLRGLAQLRQGLGVPFIKSAGNSFGEWRLFDPKSGAPNPCTQANAAGLSCHNPGMDPGNYSPTTLVTGAVNAEGSKSSYSSAGSSVFVAGLGGEFGIGENAYNPNNRPLGPAFVTTDWSGCQRGFVQWSDENRYRNPFENPGSELARERNPGCRYTSVMNGTSSAAPTVSGVVALMLSANPSLTWRDVRDILVQTSRQDILTPPPVVRLPLADGEYIADAGWTTNAAGYRHSTWYGYGLVDAGAAVAAAQERQGGRLVGGLLDAGWVTSGPPPASEDEIVFVPPGSVQGGALEIPVDQALRVESLLVRVHLAGEAPLSDLGIEVISPAGTRSVVLSPYTYWQTVSPDDVELPFTLPTQAFYGELAQGTWQVRVVDVNSRGATEPEAALLTAAIRPMGRRP